MYKKTDYCMQIKFYQKSFGKYSRKPLKINGLRGITLKEENI